MSTMYIAPDVAGQGETVTASLNDGSFDFSTIPTHLTPALTVSLLARGGVSAALNFIMQNPRIVDSRTIEFDIPTVGPLNPAGTNVPEGYYLVNVRMLGWAASGHPDLRIQRAPTVTPAIPSVAPTTPTPRPPRRSVGYSYPPGWRFLMGLSRITLQYLIIPASRLLRRFMTTTPMLLLTGRMPIRLIGAVRGGARAVALFGMPGPQPRVRMNSVQPLVDAEENFPVWEQLINDADEYIYIATLAFDELTNLKNTSQAYGPSNTSNLWTGIGKALKNRVARSLTNPVEIRVLLWETTFFADANEYEPHMTDIGDLGTVVRKWGQVRGNSRTDFLINMRQVSAAPDALLKRFYDSYQGADDDDDLPFPSGIETALQEHPTRSTLGSHHQKFILTEKGAWIGGLNTLKQQWDFKLHWYNDQRRASSGEGPTSAGVGDNAPWHDTGALVKGDVVAKVFKTFAERWDQAVLTRGPYHALVGELPTGNGRLANYLRDRAFARASRFAGARRVNRSVAEQQYIVDSANVAVSLPKGTAWALNRGATEIQQHYRQALDKMSHPDSFIYFENQYFTDYDYTKRLYARWKDNKLNGPPLEVLQYFTFVVIPYVPQPTLDWTEGRFIHYIHKAEMRCLKWLEVKTARSIFTRDANDQWVRFCGVQDPVRDIEFLDSDVQDDPEELDSESEFKVKRAVQVNPDGSWRTDANGNPLLIRPDPEFEVEDVMTDSDIMAFTLASNREAHGSSSMGIKGSVVAGEDVDERLHEYLEKYHIYTHSKATTFFNRENDNYVATIGSANINPRSLDDSDHQDSEMNIWWSGEPRVTGLRDSLWTHHLGLSGSSYDVEISWAEKAWENLETIMHARDRSISGAVVRLDVVDRWDQL